MLTKFHNMDNKKNKQSIVKRRIKEIGQEMSEVRKRMALQKEDKLYSDEIQQSRNYLNTLNELFSFPENIDVIHQFKLIFLLFHQSSIYLSMLIKFKQRINVNREI